MIVVKILQVILLAIGLYILLNAVINKEYSYEGKRKIAKLRKFSKEKVDIWSVFPINYLLKLTSKIVYLDENAPMLEKKLQKAQIKDSVREYVAKKYLSIFLGFVSVLICFSLKFYIGIMLAVLGTVFLLLKIRDKLEKNTKAKDEEIAQEMPRFVRSICRNLQTNRDLVKVFKSYRKVAGEKLGKEIDILLVEMNAGNVQNALVHFENRIGSANAFRVCAALRDMAMGIDQSATLAYLADSMAIEVKENLKRELAMRPMKMRASFYGAIVICVLMIMYVLVCFVVESLNNII